jgi:hypothetical protein
MKKLKSKQKKTLARKLMSQSEIEAHVSPFLSKGWQLRSESIAKRAEKSNKISKK